MNEIKSKLFAVFGVCFVFITLLHGGRAEEKKRLKVVLDKLEKVKDAEHLVNTQITFDKEGDDVVVNGFVESFADLGDEYRLNFDFLHSETPDGEMKKLLSIKDKGLCEIMKNQYKHFFYETLKHHGNAPEPEVCPVPKNKYTVSKYPLETAKFAPYLRHGWYHVVATLIHKGAEVLIYRVEAHTGEE